MTSCPDESTIPTPRTGPVWAAARRSLVAGTLLALGAATFYGINIPAARIASAAGIVGADLIFYRALLLAPLIALLLRATATPMVPARGEGGTILRLALAGGLTGTFYLSAIDHLPVPMGVTIFYTFPLVVMLLSARLDGRRLRPAQIAIFAIAFAGLMAAVGPSLENLSGRGITYAVLASLACASLFILAGRVTGPPLRTLLWMQLGALPIGFAFAVLQGGPAPPSGFFAAPVAVSIVIGAFAIAAMLQFAAAQRISPGRTALLFLLEPVVSIVLAGVILNETLVPVQIAGVIAILVALATEILLDRPMRSDA